MTLVLMVILGKHVLYTPQLSSHFDVKDGSNNVKLPGQYNISTCMVAGLAVRSEARITSIYSGKASNSISPHAGKRFQDVRNQDDPYPNDVTI